MAEHLVDSCPVVLSKHALLRLGVEKLCLDSPELAIRYENAALYSSWPFTHKAVADAKDSCLALGIRAYFLGQLGYTTCTIVLRASMKIFGALMPIFVLLCLPQKES